MRVRTPVPVATRTGAQRSRLVQHVRARLRSPEWRPRHSPLLRSASATATVTQHLSAERTSKADLYAALPTHTGGEVQMIIATTPTPDVIGISTQLVLSMAFA